MSMIKIGMIGIAAVFLALLLKKEKITREEFEHLFEGMEVSEYKI